MIRIPPVESVFDDEEVPYFLFDRRVTGRELREILADRAHPKRAELLAAMLREARPEDVWAWIDPHTVADELPALAPRLGRRRELWEWLIAGWRDLGLLPPT